MSNELNALRNFFGFVFAGLLLVVFNLNSVLPASAAQDASRSNSLLQLEDTYTPTSSPTSTSTPTFTPTPTPVTGLSFNGWSKGCTGGPYITCSASVTSTHTDPYRWDFDITFTYGDNRTNFGSNFTLNLEFGTGVFNTDVPIWWNMYPITNEVMPNRMIDVQYVTTPDLPSMSYPSGNWIIQEQPSPYQKFWVNFSRTTTVPQILVRTDKWHLTLATYPNWATPTNTPTNTYTPTKTSTFTATSSPTITPSATPTNTPTPPSWYTGNGRYEAYGVRARISVPSSLYIHESGESSWVSIPMPYWVQAGWRYYNGLFWPAPKRYIEYNHPVLGYGINHIGDAEWNTTDEYQVYWDPFLSRWCASVVYVSGHECYDVASAPSLVLARSEVHVSSQNQLDTYFSEVYYMDDTQLWFLFDQEHWIEEAPYRVYKYHFYEFQNYGPLP